jgi:uncharacterized protein (DUF305 family)
MKSVVRALCVVASVACSTAVAAAQHPADVSFMQGMIGHHAQAVQMTSLVQERTRQPQLRALAERIAVSQRDEIDIMSRWLTEQKQPVPATGEHALHVAGAGHSNGHSMPGMLSPAQMDSLTAASGATFDTLFLQYMIQHHEGALVMVADLLKVSGAARDPMIFQFASDVDTDQRAEIRRMRSLLATVKQP